MIGSNWKRYGYILRWLTSLGLLAFVIIKIDFQVLTKLTGTITWYYYFAGIVLAVLANALASLRWKLLTTSATFIELFRLNLISNFYAFLSGTTVFADFIKLSHVGNPDVSKVELISSMLVDKGLALIGAAITLLIGVSIAEPNVKLRLLPISILLAVFSVGILFVVRSNVLIMIGSRVARSKVYDLIARKVPTIETRAIAHNAVILVSNNRKVAGAILLTLLFNGAFTCIYLAWSQVFAINVSLGTYVTIAVLTQIVGLIPLSIAGVGVRDLTTVAILISTGVPEANAAVASISFYPIVLALAGVGFIATSRSLHFSRSS